MKKLSLRVLCLVLALACIASVSPVSYAWGMGGENELPEDILDDTLPNVVMKEAKAHASGIIVSWNKVSGAVLYQLYRRAADETSWTLIKNTGSLAYKDTETLVGVRYYYKAIARDGEMKSDLNIAAVSAVRTGVDSLKGVTMTEAIGHATGNIIRWEAVLNAQVYQVYRRASTETSWTLLKNTGSLGYKDESAAVGIKYYYKVVARRGSVKSTMDIAAVSATRPGQTALEDVKMESAQGHVTGNIIRWNAVKGARLYQVYRLTSGESSWTLLKNTGVLAYKDTEAKAGIRYYYKVVARNGDMKSSMNIASVSAVRPKISSVTYTVKTMDHSRCNAQGTRLAVITYDKVTLNGDFPSVQYINAQLEETYSKFLENSADRRTEDIGELEAWMNSMGITPGALTDVERAQVSCNRNGIFSILYSYEWFWGGVYNTGRTGMTFDLNTGDRLSLSDLASVSSKVTDAKLRGIIARYIDSHPQMDFFGSGSDIAAGLDLSKVDYIIVDGQIIVTFYGGHIAPMSSGSISIETGIYL